MQRTLNAPVVVIAGLTRFKCSEEYVRVNPGYGLGFYADLGPKQPGNADMTFDMESMTVTVDMGKLVEMFYAQHKLDGALIESLSTLASKLEVAYDFARHHPMASRGIIEAAIDALEDMAEALAEKRQKSGIYLEEILN